MSETVRRGSRGPDVRRWQALIGAHITGVFDDETERLTIAWQIAHRLKADGVVSQETWAAMRACDV